MKLCKYGFKGCICCWCEKKCKNGLQCEKCELEYGEANITYFCTGFVGKFPLEMMDKEE